MVSDGAVDARRRGLFTCVWIERPRRAHDALGHGLLVAVLTGRAEDALPSTRRGSRALRATTALIPRRRLLDGQKVPGLAHRAQHATLVFGVRPRGAVGANRRAGIRGERPDGTQRPRVGRVRTRHVQVRSLRHLLALLESLLVRVRSHGARSALRRSGLGGERANRVRLARHAVLGVLGPFEGKVEARIARRALRGLVQLVVGTRGAGQALGHTGHRRVSPRETRVAL